MAVSPPMSSHPFDSEEPYPVPRRYAWMVFAMTFGLMMSDYLSRQVINAIFPFLKADWGLSDTQLGMLVSVVALTVGIMSVPISFLADRIGRVKSATIMALVWAGATVACGFSESFVALLIARALVGLGEAGYGSAGSAILAHAFPTRLHSTVMGSFLAAAMIGSVLGVVLGGLIAQHLGWRMAFIAMGVFGLVLAVSFPFVVKEPPNSGTETGAPRMPVKEVFRHLFFTRTAVYTFLATGFGMFTQGAFLAWLPSYLNRYYGLEPAKAAMAAGVLVVCTSIGMIVGGGLVDRFSRHNKANRLRISLVYCLSSALTFFVAFSLDAGAVQYCLIGLGLMLSAGFAGPSSAVVSDVTPSSIHATTFAVLALCYALLGMAPGPVVTGWIGDYTSLKTAMLIVPSVSLIAAVMYYLASRHYLSDRARVHGDSVSS